MARTAQDVLEFDKLRELLRLRTTCALGKRAVDALEPGIDQPALERAFAQIREAQEWLRAGRELGFGGLADPQQWLERIEGPGVVLDAGALLDAASLLETAGWLRQPFREEGVKFPLRAAKPGDQRRCVSGVAQDSREHHADARINSESAETNLARAKRGGRRGLCHAAQRSLRDSGTRGEPAKRARDRAWHQWNGANGFSRAVRDGGDEQPACTACGRGRRRNPAHSA